MQRALLAARPLLRAGLRRSLSATAPAAVEPAAAAAAAAPAAAAAAAPAAAVVTTQSSSLWHKLLAFSAGLAVGGAYYVATMQDTWRNDDALERSVAALRRETVRGGWRGPPRGWASEGAAGSPAPPPRGRPARIRACSLHLTLLSVTSPMVLTHAGQDHCGV